MTSSPWARQRAAHPEPMTPESTREMGEDGSGGSWIEWLVGLWLAGALVGVADLVHRRRRFVASLRRAPFPDVDASERLHTLTDDDALRLTSSRSLASRDLLPVTERR